MLCLLNIDQVSGCSHVTQPRDSVRRNMRTYRSSVPGRWASWHFPESLSTLQGDQSLICSQGSDTGTLGNVTLFWGGELAQEARVRGERGHKALRNAGNHWITRSRGRPGDPGEERGPWNREAQVPPEGWLERKEHSWMTSSSSSSPRPFGEKSANFTRRWKVIRNLWFIQKERK